MFHSRALGHQVPTTCFGLLNVSGADTHIIGGKHSGNHLGRAQAGKQHKNTCLHCLGSHATLFGFSRDVDLPGPSKPIWGHLNKNYNGLGMVRYIHPIGSLLAPYCCPAGQSPETKHIYIYIYIYIYICSQYLDRPIVSFRIPDLKHREGYIFAQTMPRLLVSLTPRTWLPPLCEMIRCALEAMEARWARCRPSRPQKANLRTFEPKL